LILFRRNRNIPVVPGRFLELDHFGIEAVLPIGKAG
jgi:hypothetical protein